MLYGFLPCWGTALRSCHQVQTVCCPCLRHLRRKTHTHGVTVLVTSGLSLKVTVEECTPHDVAVWGVGRQRRVLKCCCQQVPISLWDMEPFWKTFTGAVGSSAQLSDDSRGLPTGAPPVPWATGGRRFSGERADGPSQNAALLCPSKGKEQLRLRVWESHSSQSLLH